MGGERERVKCKTVKWGGGGGELPFILRNCTDYIFRALFRFLLRNPEGMFVIFAGRVSMAYGRKSNNRKIKVKVNLKE